jgi:hypothetical protein
MDLVLAKIKTHVVATFAELGIADLLAHGPKAADELAQMTCTDQESLYRLLRMLTALHIVDELAVGRYALTPAGALLRSDLPGSMRGLAVLFGSQFHGNAWGHLTDSVKTGESAFRHAFGMTLFEYLGQNPTLAAAFDEGMTASSIAQSRAVADAYDFSGIETLTDVGGGHGTLLTTILKAYPTMRGVLVERPPVAAAAGKVLDAAGVSERVDVQAVDFFDHVPKGADAYIMKRIIHDWHDARAVQILRNCRNAMNPQGRVLVVDAVIDESDNALYAKLLDIEMLVLSPSGRERTEAEFRRLLLQAGLKLERIVSTASPLQVLEATMV